MAAEKTGARSPKKPQKGSRPSSPVRAYRAGKRTLIDTGSNKRFVKRDEKGRFKESDDVGRSLTQDRRKKAKTKVKPGYGDRGDQPPKKSSKKK